ncbi:hypothetical protein FA15DRAFT_703370 [Coprinopsis marcescibilis]|uniref:Rhodopsin domain-containing protein n=1 Tax=Coprinopsis marcescibilis TaxID=230819 RepID=A0A5C3KZA1_COPMA|nr:hypothetical protein FA15DRAFT_703370 [Coprinopsis marcescibilis]
MASTIESVSFSCLQITASLLLSLATLFTGCRLYDRQDTRRLWWDDFWALVGMVLCILLMVSIDLLLDIPETHSHALPVVTYYIATFAHHSLIWSSRLSIIFTLIRLQYGVIRAIFGGIGGLLGLMWLATVVQITWVCQANRSWQQEPNHEEPQSIVQCPQGLSVGVTLLVATILSDVILVFAPLYIVFKSRHLRPIDRVRLYAMFSTTLLATALSLAHAQLVISGKGRLELLIGIIQAATAQTVVNIPVLFSFCLRTSGSIRKQFNLSPLTTTGISAITEDSQTGSLTQTRVSGYAGNGMGHTFKADRPTAPIRCSIDNPWDGGNTRTVFTIFNSEDEVDEPEPEGSLQQHEMPSRAGGDRSGV